jgi:TolA-binding protein
LQTGATDKAVAGFTGLIDGYPTVDSLSSAYYYRAIAKLRSKDLPGAQKDLSTLISKYPKSKEREPALEQRAIIQGQLNDNNGMSETYQLLLKDFPNTPAAADANYWIGWVAFENKSYKDVPGPLGRARDLDKEKYFERASLRILLSHYYVENWEAVAREIDLYQTAGGKGQVPEQVLRGVGMHFYEVGDRSENADERKKNFGEAAKYLGQMCKRDEAKPDDFLNLGRSRLFLDDFKNAVEPLDKYLHESKEPAPRCVALINLSRAHLGLRDFDAAQKCVNEALPLQPEGRLNAEVRTLSGDIQAGRGNPEEAAKIYEAITVIIDEEEVTPPALEKAVEAYKKAGREADAKRLFNTLQSRYPEYVQRKKKGA